MTSNALTLTPINGEPRVHDLHLAGKLGFADQYMIRKLIKRNEDKLLKFGVVYTVETTPQGPQGGRPATEFYLNQKQAVFVCMKSETEKAFDVQAEIVRVFDAYLNGDLKPATQATIVTQPRMYFAATRIARNLEFSRSIGGRAAMYDQLRAAHQQLGLPPIMPLEMFGKPADQMPLEI